MKQKTLFIVSGIALFLAFLAGSLVYKSEKKEEKTQTLVQHQANLTRMHSPTLGPADARVQIVEFFDPACGTCRDFFPYVKQLMAAHPGQVRLAMRHAPFHEGSDNVVKILEAARRQNKYWETLEALYATQDDWTQNHRVVMDRVWAALTGVGLNLDQVRQDMDAPEIAALIAQDLDDASSLNVTMTPEFFVNGRPLPSFGQAQLQTLVEDAVAENYR